MFANLVLEFSEDEYFLPRPDLIQNYRTITNQENKYVGT